MPTRSERGLTTALTATSQSPLPDELEARIPLSVRPPVAPLPYESFDGFAVPIPLGTGRPLWVVLWASWCRPCLVELEKVTAQASELNSAGIEVLFLAVNGVGTDESDPDIGTAVFETNFIITKNGVEEITPIPHLFW